MSDGDRNHNQQDRRLGWGACITFLVAIFIAVGLYPRQEIAGRPSTNEFVYAPGNEAEGSCSPSAIKALSVGKRLGKSEACKAAAYERARQRDEYIQTRRSADAAAAQAAYAFDQTKVASIGAGLGFVTMAAALGAAWYARQAAIHTEQGANEAKRSADAAHQANRPWLSIELKRIISIKADKAQGGDGIRIDLEIAVINHGNSPAISVYVDNDLTLRPSLWPTYLSDFLKRWDCDRGSSGLTRFPTQPLTIAITNMIFDHSIKSDAEILGDKFISPIIAVCVTYFHPGSITRHQTGVLWRLGLDKGVTGEMMIDISKEDWWNDRNLRVFEGHQHIAT